MGIRRFLIAFMIVTCLQAVLFTQSRPSVQTSVQHGILLADGVPAFRVFIAGWVPDSPVTLDLADSAGDTYSIVGADSGASAGSDGTASFDIPYSFRDARPGNGMLLLSGKDAVHTIILEIPEITPPSEDNPGWKLVFSDRTLVIPVTQIFPDGRAIIRSNGHEFRIKIPADWQIDTVTLAEYDICALFYRKGVEFGDTVPHLYISAVNREVLCGDSVTDFIRWDMDRSAGNGAEVVSGADFKLPDGNLVPVREYIYDDGYRERVAYIDVPEGIVVFVLAAVSESEYREARAAYTMLLSSYLSVSN